MGNSLCQDVTQDEKIQFGSGDQVHKKQLQNNIKRKDVPKVVAYNINHLTTQKKDSKIMTDFQQKINRMMSHQRRHNRPYMLTKSQNKDNYLPDPYFLNFMEAIYIGQWAFDKDINDDVPWGIGRLYTEDYIIQGEIKTIDFSYMNEDQMQALKLNKKANMLKQTNTVFSKAKVAEQTKFVISNINTYRVCLDGEGRKITRNSQFNGNFVNGQLQGKGYCRIKEEEDVYEYTGQFKRGKKHGKGIQKFKLTTYDGDFQNDNKKGRGVLTLFISLAYNKERIAEEEQLAIQNKEKDASKVSTKVQTYFNLKNAFEVKLASVLSKYKWQKPTAPVKSMLQSQNFITEHHSRTKFLQQYKGQFQNNLFHGEGMYTWFNGKVYFGAWTEGKMDGPGEFYWPNGSVYRGIYQKDMKHGKGEMIWSFTRRYRGSWAYSLRHGYGELIEISKGSTEQEAVVEVKGCLWCKDKIQKVFFEQRQTFKANLSQVIDIQLQMIAFIKDIKLDS